MADIPSFPTLEHIESARMRALVESVLTVASDLELSRVLGRIVQAAADLVDAQYAALGVIDETGTELIDFLTVGIGQADSALIGHLPTGHGVLGMLIREPEPLRLTDISRHPESFGFPPNHPPMKSFLGVPVRIHNRVFGNLYLTNKRSSTTFTEVDEEVVVALAAAAAVAIENARLHARVEEMAVVEDRERIARDLHDTVIQRLFAVGLGLQATAQVASGDAGARIEVAVDELDSIIREVRSAIFQLEAPTATTGLVASVSAVCGEVSRALGFDVKVNFGAGVESLELPSKMRHSLVSTLREALSNVARHAQATASDVEVVVVGHDLVLKVSDNGVGIGAFGASFGKGITNASERAKQLGGALMVTNRAVGGTILEWRVPLTTV